MVSGSSFKPCFARIRFEREIISEISLNCFVSNHVLLELGLKDKFYDKEDEVLVVSNHVLLELGLKAKKPFLEKQ